jgi:mannose-P-dolichol utilization defect 1
MFLVATLRVSFLFFFFLVIPLQQLPRPSVRRSTTSRLALAPPTAAMDALRSVVQPITHNLPAPIRDLGVSLIGPACYSTLLLDVDLANQECLKLAVSKGLGIGIIAASSGVKVPQILKISRSQSAEGLSFLSYLLETIAYTIGLAYNVRSGFPFSTFGETVFIVVQNVVITFMILKYSGREGSAFIFLGTLLAVVPALFLKDMVPMDFLSYLQAGAGALGVAAKVPQIATVFSEGTTGQLSAFAVSTHLNVYAPDTKAYLRL